MKLLFQDVTDGLRNWTVETKKTDNVSEPSLVISQIDDCGNSNVDLRLHFAPWHLYALRKAIDEVLAEEDMVNWFGANETPDGYTKSCEVGS